MSRSDARVIANRIRENLKYDCLPLFYILIEFFQLANSLKELVCFVVVVVRPQSQFVDVQIYSIVALVLVHIYNSQTRAHSITDDRDTYWLQIHLSHTRHCTGI